MFQSCSLNHAFYSEEPFHMGELTIIDSDFIHYIEIDIPNGWHAWHKISMPYIADSIVKVYSDKKLDIGYNLYLFSIFLFELYNKSTKEKSKKERLTKNKIYNLLVGWNNFNKYEKDIYKYHAKYHRMKCFL